MQGCFLYFKIEKCQKSCKLDTKISNKHQPRLISQIAPVWGQCQNWTDMEISEYCQFPSYKTLMCRNSCSLNIYKVAHVKYANTSKLSKLGSKDLLLLGTPNYTQQLSWSRVSIPICQIVDLDDIKPHKPTILWV